MCHKQATSIFNYQIIYSINLMKIDSCSHTNKQKLKILYTGILNEILSNIFQTMIICALVRAF